MADNKSINPFKRAAEILSPDTQASTPKKVLAPVKAAEPAKVVAYKEYRDEDRSYMDKALSGINKRLSRSNQKRSMSLVPKRSTGR